jgi:hypothetical protein
MICRIEFCLWICYSIENSRVVWMFFPWLLQLTLPPGWNGEVFVYTTCRIHLKEGKMKPVRCFLVVFAMICLVLLPTGCRPAGGGDVATAMSLAKGYVDAYQAKDAEKFFGLMDNDAIYSDQGRSSIRNSGDFYMRNLNTAIAQTFQDPVFAYVCKSYFVSSDGQFATAQCLYTDTGIDGNPATVPAVSILEFKNGKIIKETMYYDGSPYE